MPESPQVETQNTLTIDFADSPELKEIFANKDVGHKCDVKFHVQVMSKYPEGVQLYIEKVYTEGYGGEDKDVKPDMDHPIMATMKSRKPKDRGMQGPHNRPPQTAENSAEPWLTSYT